MSNMSFCIFIASVCLIIVGYNFALDTVDEVKYTNDNYCKMVTLSIETQGEFGWPDYNNIYEKECL